MRFAEISPQKIYTATARCDEVNVKLTDLPCQGRNGILAAIKNLWQYREGAGLCLQRTINLQKSPNKIIAFA